MWPICPNEYFRLDFKIERQHTKLKTIKSDPISEEASSGEISDEKSVQQRRSLGRHPNLPREKHGLLSPTAQRAARETRNTQTSY